MLGGGCQFFESFDSRLIIDLGGQIVGKWKESLSMETDPPFPGDEILAAE